MIGEILFVVIVAAMIVVCTKSAYSTGYKHGYVRGKHNMEEEYPNEGEKQ